MADGGAGVVAGFDSGGEDVLLVEDLFDVGDELFVGGVEVGVDDDGLERAFGKAASE